MNLRVSAAVERIRASLFLTPLLLVFFATALGLALLQLDSRLGDETSSWPIGLSSTVESARALLSTVASATIAFAGIAFSVSLLTIQLASSQHSPRIVHTLFRDPFNKRIMGLVVGTFTYCLIVLRSVRSAIDSSGDPVIPNISVAMALLFGIITVLALVAFINHNAHAMDISEILERVRSETTQQIDRESSDENRVDVSTDDWPQSGTVVKFASQGWIQQIDTDALLALVPPGGRVRLDTGAGRYAIAGTALCRVYPPCAADEEDGLQERANDAVILGSTRTMQQDASYGMRQLADVALKALSPGINDPTTAQDAIFHVAAVLRDLLLHVRSSAVIEGPEQRRLWMTQEKTPDDLVRGGFEEIRQAAASQPVVCIYLLEALKLLRECVDNPDARRSLAREASLVVAGVEASDALPHDVNEVRRAYAHRFGNS